MITIAITISHGHHLRHLLIPPLMKTCFSSKIGKSTTAQPKIRPFLSFFGMTGSGDLLKFRFSKSSYSLSSKMGQDGQEKPVTTRGKTGFLISIFKPAARKNLIRNNLYLYLCDTSCKKKKQFVFQFGCKLVRGVGLGEAATSDKKKRQNN